MKAYHADTLDAMKAVLKGRRKIKGIAQSLAPHHEGGAIFSLGSVLWDLQEGTLRLKVPKNSSVGQGCTEWGRLGAPKHHPHHHSVSQYWAAED